MSNRNDLHHSTGCASEFDTLVAPKRQRISLRRANYSDLAPALGIAERELPSGFANSGVIARILSHNRNNILLFERDTAIVGFWAMLMLTPIGLERLLVSELDTLNPGPECLARMNERPAAIYNWAVAAPGRAVEGVYHVSQFLRKPTYRNSNIYSRPNTQAGVRFNQRLGSRPLPSRTDGLYRYERLANRQLVLNRAA